MKPQRKKFNITDKDKFRNTKQWRVKREQIRKRDLQMCQICIRNLYNTINQYTFENLSVHHAISLEKDYSKRLDDENLITTCDYHHEEMEKGNIPLNVVLEIIGEQEKKKSA